MRAFRVAAARQQGKQEALVVLLAVARSGAAVFGNAGGVSAMVGRTGGSGVSGWQAASRKASAKSQKTLRIKN
jgi:hypothetical protein